MNDIRQMELKFEQPLAFQGAILPKGSRLVGLAALIHGLKLQAPARGPSCVSEGYIRGSQRREDCWMLYDKRYWPGDLVTDHIGFAFSHELIDLLVLKRTFDTIDPAVIEEFIRGAPTGALARRVWFFYETLTGKRLALEDAGTVRAVDALDNKAYFTSKPELSRRHRVRNNLLGHGGYVPIIRRTAKLEEFQKLNLLEKAAETIGRTGAHRIARAASFLLLADSQASFEIEGERPPRNRLERWGRAVLQVGKNKLRLEELVRLQDIVIEDTRFIKAGLRKGGVFLGERNTYGDPLPEFIGARPDDLETLMDGLMAANERMRENALDPVLQAAATAFGFVYIHPFEDGNGRVHRCLIHHVLAERKFTPPGMVFPVSSVMLDRIDNYQTVLQDHSGPLMEYMDWQKTPERNVHVVNDTGDLYRYFDCTKEAEFLYECVARTIEHDLPTEIEHLRRHDEMQRKIMEMIEMPDRLAQDLIMFIRQNKGRLPKKRREKEFAALADDEVMQIEAMHQEIFADAND
ncbi:MAG: hypothetical protein ACI9FD_000923 [Gammaproteobacteria bacterium]|jgi:hypothetical protein